MKYSQITLHSVSHANINFSDLETAKGNRQRTKRANCSEILACGSIKTYLKTATKDSLVVRPLSTLVTSNMQCCKAGSGLGLRR